jgi:alanine racemase
MANTGAIVHGKALGIDQMCNVIRPGLGLYGYGASANVAVKPVLTWWVQILKTRKLDAGERVGYSGTFTAKSTMAAAVLGVGYGDGFLRAHSNGQLWNGKLSPRRILGRVSMDLTIIEGRGLKVGDWVSLVGENPAQAEKLATQGQTIVYEVLTALSPRVPRVYSTLENERS